MSKRRKRRRAASRDFSGAPQPYHRISEKIKDVAQPWVRALGSDPPLDVMQTVHFFVANLWSQK